MIKSNLCNVKWTMLIVGTVFIRIVINNNLILALIGAEYVILLVVQASRSSGIFGHGFWSIGTVS